MCNLNEKQKQFVDKYCLTFNASRAYREIYGCEPASAWTGASRLMADENVSGYISAKLKKLAESKLLTPAYALSHLQQMIEAEGTDDRSKISCLKLLCKYLGMSKEDLTVHQDKPEETELRIVTVSSAEDVQDMKIERELLEKERKLLEEAKKPLLS